MFYDYHIRKEFCEKFLTGQSADCTFRIEHEFPIVNKNTIADIAVFKAPLFAFNEKTVISKIESILEGKELYLEDFHGLTAFEIKSPKDNLNRLEKQANDYKKVFNYTYIIINEEFLSESLGLIPQNFGVMLYDETLSFSIFRQANRNETDKKEVLGLLNENELSYILRNVLYIVGEYQTREEMISSIIKFLSHKQIDAIVSLFLSIRKDNLKSIAKK